MKLAKKLLLMGGRAATPWYLAGGIPAANCIAAYQAIGAASYAASKVNLANPGTYNLTDPKGTVTWDAAVGWSGDNIQDSATAKYFSTGIVPTYGMTAILRYSSFTAYVFLGSSTTDAAAERFRMEYGLGAKQFRVFNGTNAASYKDFAGDVSTGTFAVAGRSLFGSGVYKDILPDSSPTPTTYPIYLLAYNYANSNARYFLAGNLLAVAFYDITLDPSIIEKLHGAMMALPASYSGATVYQGSPTIRDITYASSLGD